MDMVLHAHNYMIWLDKIARVPSKVLIHAPSLKSIKEPSD